MIPDYSFIPDLSARLPEIPADSILSSTFYSDGQVKAILFRFAAGQELSEHTASKPAILRILSGAAKLTLGKAAFDAREGAWAHMPANLPHSLLAKTPVVMLLLLLNAGG